MSSGCVFNMSAPLPIIDPILIIHEFLDSKGCRILAGLEPIYLQIFIGLRYGLAVFSVCH